MNKEEAQIIKKFIKFRGEKWIKYIDAIDPVNLAGENKLDIKTRELMRMSFLSGMWCYVSDMYGLDKDTKDKENE